MSDAPKVWTGPVNARECIWIILLATVTLRLLAVSWRC